MFSRKQHRHNGRDEARIRLSELILDKIPKTRISGMITEGDMVLDAYSAAADTAVIITNSGAGFTARLGVETYTPRRRVDILDAASPQLRLTHTDNTIFGEFHVDAAGDLYLDLPKAAGDTTFYIRNTDAGKKAHANIEGDLVIGGVFTGIANITGTNSPTFVIDEDNAGAAVDTILAFERGSSGNDAELLWDEANTKFQMRIVGTAMARLDVLNINSMVISDLTVHDAFTDDDHTQYHTNARHDARNVNTHADIVSAGALIEDAVSKRHTQGTDTGTTGTTFILDEDNAGAGVNTALLFNRGTTANDARIVWDEAGDLFAIMATDTLYAKVQVDQLIAFTLAQSVEFQSYGCDVSLHPLNDLWCHVRNKANDAYRGVAASQFYCADQGVTFTGLHDDLGGRTANNHHNQSHNHSAAADGTALTPVNFKVPSDTTASERYMYVDWNTSRLYVYKAATASWWYATLTEV